MFGKCRQYVGRDCQGWNKAGCFLGLGLGFR